MDLLNIVQWNAQSLVSNRLNLTHFLNENNIHIALISETWLKPNIRLNIRGYQVERNDCGNKHNGVAILIHNSITYSKINTYYDNSLQNICVRIKINGKEISIVSFYSPSNCSPAFDKFKFDSLIKSIPEPMIFAGDFNAHHTSWGCVDTQPRGRDVLDVIDDNDVVLLNDGQATTVGSMSWRPNALDLTLASTTLASFCDWSIHEDPLGSYHLPVIIKVVVSNRTFSNETNCSGANMHLPIYPKYKQVDWKMFVENFVSLLAVFRIDSYTPLDAYKTFCDLIKIAVEKSIPNISSNSSDYRSCHRKSRLRPNLPWWNDKCTEAVLKSKEAYLNFKYHPCEENYLEFKRLQALKKLTLKIERNSSWVALCNSFNRCTPLSVIWKFVRKFNKSYVPNNKNDDSWISAFLNKYTPDFVCNKPDISHNLNMNSNNSFLLKPFSMQELKSAIFSRRDTAFGLDGIPYIVFKKMNDECLSIFLRILNQLWLNNEIPSNWKEDCLVPILKPEKPKSDPNSYRPIALTSCVAKIFEQLLKQRLEFFIEQNGLLPSNQYGFRRGRSSRESICQLHLDIFRSISSNQYLLSVFFDISGAFNNVNLSVLCSELMSIGLPGKLVDWIYTFLSERNLFVKYNNHLYGARLSSLGVCQGGILSPLLFILYIRRLNIILGSSVKNLQFADDLAVYASGDDLAVVADSINDALAALGQYFAHLNLDVNPTKSKVVFFGRKSVVLPVVCYRGVPLPVSYDVRFLGVIFTQNLSWGKYIDKIIARANKAFNILKSLSATYWGADPKVLLTLYKSLVRSHFEYGFFCYSDDPKIVNKLELVQNKCMRLITGAFKSTPIGALQIECKLPPISIRLSYLRERFILKLYYISNNTLLKNLINASIELRRRSIYILQELSSTTTLLQNLNIYHVNSTLPCYQGLFISKFPKMNIVIDHNLTTKEDVRFKLLEWHDHRFIYTDGSKNHDSVSFAIFDEARNLGHGHKIDSLASVFTAEAAGILFALKHIKSYNALYTHWVVASDSMSVLKNLQNNKLNANTNYIIYKIKELWTELIELNIQVVFVWVPSHIGVVGNEKADYLAKSIVNFVTIDNDFLDTISLPFTDVVRLLKQRMCEKWGRHWYHCTEIQNKGCWYASLDIQVDSSPWFSKNHSYVNKKFYSTICRLRFGHCRLNFHLHRLKLSNSSQCNHCDTQEIQTLNHIFFDCPSFGIQRLVLMDELLRIYGTGNLVPHCIKEILKCPLSYMALYKFVTFSVGNI